jgi:hypothetical protein
MKRIGLTDHVILTENCPGPRIALWRPGATFGRTAEKERLIIAVICPSPIPVMPLTHFLAPL